MIKYRLLDDKKFETEIRSIIPIQDILRIFPQFLWQPINIQPKWLIKTVIYGRRCCRYFALNTLKLASSQRRRIYHKVQYYQTKIFHFQKSIDNVLNTICFTLRLLFIY